MKPFKVCSAVVALSLVSTAAPTSADTIKNIVLVHGAWVDASGWKPIYEILTKDGFNVTMVQEPETSFPDDVAATKRVLDLQDGPTLLVGHSYGGSIITEAGRRGCARQENAKRPGQDRGRDQENAGRIHLSQPGGLSQAGRF